MNGCIASYCTVWALAYINVALQSKTIIKKNSNTDYLVKGKKEETRINNMSNE